MYRHQYSFFGQKSAVILDSGPWEDPHIFLRFLKKKEDGSWEKPRNKEGKNIKLNMLELVALLAVCGKKSPKWSTVHKFGEETTPISAEIIKGTPPKEDTMSISIPGYVKQLSLD